MLISEWRLQSREQDALPQEHLDTLRSVAELAGSGSDQRVWLRARVQNVRSKGNSCFLVLRQGTETVQAAIFKGANVSKEMLRFCAALPKVRKDFAQLKPRPLFGRATTLSARQGRACCVGACVS